MKLQANYKFNDLKVPLPDDIVPLRQVYEILLSVHGCDKDECSKLPPATYRFTPEALAISAAQHDVLIQRKQDIENDDQRHSVICKAIGQLARLCGVLYALEQAFGVAEEVTELDNNKVEEWESEIDEATCKKAVLIMDYLTEEKFRLMSPKFTIQSVAALVNNDPKEQFVIDEGTKIKKTLEYEGTKKSIPGKITLSEAVQGRLFTPPKKNGKAENTAANAIPFLEHLCDCGFGTMEEDKKGCWKTKIFCKRKWEDLDVAQIDKETQYDKETQSQPRKIHNIV